MGRVIGETVFNPVQRRRVEKTQISSNLGSILAADDLQPRTSLVSAQEAEEAMNNERRRLQRVSATVAANGTIDIG